MAQIANEQIIDVYEKFKQYSFKNEKEFPSLKQKKITSDIVALIKNEKKFIWNDTSLSDYINNLVYMVRGEQFARTINAFAETYLIDSICKDFGPQICENAKKSLALHKEYYRSLNNDNTKNSKKLYKEFFPQLLQAIQQRRDAFDSTFNIDITYNTQEQRPRHYLSFRAGKSNISYGCVYTKGYAKGFVVELYLDGDNYKERFEKLLTYKKEIDNAYEETLTWQEDTGSARRVFVSFEGNIENREEWESYINWQVENLIKFRRIFQSYIDTIDEGITLFNTQKTPKGNETMLKIKNIILFGSPGVGKTHNTNQLISFIEKRLPENKIFDAITLNNSYQREKFDAGLVSRINFITFHQNFGYEDFIEGFRPNEKGTIELQDGIFKSICQEARENRDENYYLVIDEINRGNISKIFGELITLIEEDKRDVIEVVLPYSKKLFTIPSNLFIIGTMNSTDKSIALIDIALRRRFTFVKMSPNYELINHSESQELLEKLNQKIKDKLGEDYQIGHSYFMKIENNADLSFVLKYKIKPLLEEYFYGDTDGLNDVLSLLEQ